MTLALTLHQPWAGAVAEGLKRIETRSWPTPYRGPLLIHAGKTVDAAAVESFVADWQRFPDPLVKGAVIATARLADCLATRTVRESLSALELYLGDYSDGRWAWILDDVRPLLEPVPCRGFQRLWRPSRSIENVVAEQLGRRTQGN